MTLHNYNPNQCPNPDKILYVKGTFERSKVKSGSHHDVAHLHTLTNVPTKYNNFLHLMVYQIQPGQDFIGQGHYGKVKGHIKVTQ